MSGISAGDSCGIGWRRAIDPVDRDALVPRLCSAATAGEPGSADWRLAGMRGRRWSRWWWQPGPARGLVVCVTKISGERHDWRRTEPAGVTALLSPGQFLTLVGRGLRRASRTGGVLAVMVVDLGGLAAGDAAPGTADRLLGAVIGRMTGATRAADVVARTGACTFAVLYEDLHDQAEAEMVAGRLRRSLQQPIDVDGRSYSAAVAIGIAVVSGPGEQAEALLARAEAMLDAAPQPAGRRRGTATAPMAACFGPVAGPRRRQPRWRAVLPQPWRRVPRLPRPGWHRHPCGSGSPPRRSGAVRAPPLRSISGLSSPAR
jgi:GGDEF domain-containing protein